MTAFTPLEDRLSALRATPELAGWSDRSLQALLPYFDEVALPSGQVIAVEGRPCAQFLIVLSGALEVESPAGDARTVGPGASLGWLAMWERRLNEAIVTVLTDARLLVMGHAQFRAVKASAVGRAA